SGFSLDMETSRAAERKDKMDGSGFPELHKKPSETPGGSAVKFFLLFMNLKVSSKSSLKESLRWPLTSVLQREIDASPPDSPPPPDSSPPTVFLLREGVGGVEANRLNVSQ
ncbi:hypothetical protein KUCAC02_035705, partial [Chaenocephalus aceratus]